MRHAELSKRFFDAVSMQRPLVICVNDNWKVRPGKELLRFHEFLQSTYPHRADWEVLGATGSSTSASSPKSSHARSTARRYAGRRVATTATSATTATTQADGLHGLLHGLCTGAATFAPFPRRAFELPNSLRPLLSQVTPARRKALRKNEHNLTAAELTASIAHLDTVDVDNSISVHAPPPG